MDPFWYTFESDFEKSSEERSESHNRNRASLLQEEIKRQREFNKDKDEY
jgi:hypothetical protein